MNGENTSRPLAVTSLFSSILRGNTQTHTHTHNHNTRLPENICDLLLCFCAFDPTLQKCVSIPIHCATTLSINSEMLSIQLQCTIYFRRFNPERLTLSNEQKKKHRDTSYIQLQYTVANVNHGV